MASPYQTGLSRLQAPRLPGRPGQLTLKGANAQFLQTFGTGGDAGTLALTGAAATLRAPASLSGVNGALSLTGADATLRGPAVLSGQKGSLALAGNATLLAPVVFHGDSGTLTLTLGSSALVPGPVLWQSSAGPAGQTGAQGAIAWTFSSQPHTLPGMLLVIVYALGDRTDPASANPGFSCSDSVGNSYTLLLSNSYDAFGPHLRIFAADNRTGPTTPPTPPVLIKITVTVSHQQELALTIAESINLASPYTLDGPVATAVGIGAPRAGQFTTSHVPDMIWIAFASDTVLKNPTAPPGFTQDWSWTVTSGTSFATGQDCYATPGGTVSQNPQWSNYSGKYAGGAIAFKGNG